MSATDRAGLISIGPEWRALFENVRAHRLPTRSSGRVRLEEFHRENPDDGARYTLDGELVRDGV